MLRGDKDVDAAPTDVTAALTYLRAHGPSASPDRRERRRDGVLVAASSDGSVPAV